MLGLPSPGLGGSWPPRTPAAELKCLGLSGGASSHTSGEILSPKRVSTLRASTQSNRGAVGDRWSH